jgi:hypothetical protein
MTPAQIEDLYQTAEFNLLCDLYATTLRRIMSENDYQAAFNARKQFLEEQRFQESQGFQSDQGFRSK